MPVATARKQHVPDILDCLAQLSNDEVPTPPKLARAMLDLLPKEVWSNPDYKWLDPCCKSGAILREAAARLLVGLEKWQPDFEKRREHIFRNMLYGTSVTELTGQVVRRSVYCSHDASGEHSVVRFKRGAGNIPFVSAKHNFGADGSETKCRICGAPKDLERGEKRENYAYAFIHGAYPTKEMSKMKFDVIVGNPPYQLGSTGGESKGNFAMPIYQKFVERTKELAPRYLVMITPSRWFAGGRNLDDFRARMLADNRIRRLVDFPDAEECFPGADVSGGVSYFLWSRDERGQCEITTILGGQPLGPTEARRLDEYDVFVRYNTGADILRKVWKPSSRVTSVAETVSPIQPFSLRTNFRGAATKKGLKRPVGVWTSSGYTYIERAGVPRNPDWIGQWKVLLGMAYGDRGKFPYKITSAPVVLPPGTVCTETYLVIERFDDKVEAERFAAYLSTRFVRFLISLRKYTQHLYSERFAFVPRLPMDRTWTDAMLYKKYKLSSDEIAFIEYQIKDMSPAGENEE
jgi:site-specific DNA-methyltransferase (adenine-specific)